MNIESELKQLNTFITSMSETLEAIKTCKTTVELEGFENQVIYGTGVPPVGAQFQAHKHTTDGGTYATFEVMSQEWALTDNVPDSESAHGSRTMFECRIKTKRIA